MKFGELAKRTGLAPSRIGFYENTGLPQAVARRARRLRDYPPGAAAVLELIDSAQRAGSPLEQNRRLLPLGDGR